MCFEAETTPPFSKESLPKKRWAFGETSCALENRDIGRIALGIWTSEGVGVGEFGQDE